VLSGLIIALYNDEWEILLKKFLIFKDFPNGEINPPPVSG